MIGSESAADSRQLRRLKKTKVTKSHPAVRRLLASSLHFKGRAPVLDVRVPSSCIGSAADSQCDSGQLKLALKLRGRDNICHGGDQLINLYDILFHRSKGVTSKIIKAN